MLHIMLLHMWEQEESFNCNNIKETWSKFASGFFIALAFLNTFVYNRQKNGEKDI